MCKKLTNTSKVVQICKKLTNTIKVANSLAPESYHKMITFFSSENEGQKKSCQLAGQSKVVQVPGQRKLYKSLARASYHKMQMSCLFFTIGCSGVSWTLASRGFAFVFIFSRCNIVWTCVTVYGSIAFETNRDLEFCYVFPFCVV